MPALPATRLSWIDTTKGLAITLVVWGHVYRGLVAADLVPSDGLLADVDATIYAFHVPLFFYLSGLLLPASLAKRGVGRFTLSRLDAIAFPFLLWSLIQGSLEHVFAAFTNRGLTELSLLQFIWPPRAQFWFLFDLIAISLLVAAELALLKRPLYLLALNAALLLAVPMLHSPVPRLAEELIYVSAGIAAARAPAPLPTAAIAALLALPAVLAAAYLQLLEPAAHHVSSLQHIAFALAGSAVAILLSGSDRLSRWLAPLGRLSMPILVMHVIFASGARIVLARLFVITDPVVHTLAGLLTGLLMPLVAYTVLARLNLRAVFGLTPPAALEGLVLPARGDR